MLTFDYQIQFGDNGEFADAVAELLHCLKEKVWLVGQSLGGMEGMLRRLLRMNRLDSATAASSASLR